MLNNMGASETFKCVSSENKMSIENLPGVSSVVNLRSRCNSTAPLFVCLYHENDPSFSLLISLGVSLHCVRVKEMANLLRLFLCSPGTGKQCKCEHTVIPKPNVQLLGI